MADVLRDELLNDPLVRGYAGMTDQQAADDLNTEYRSRDKTSMSATEVFNAIVVADFLALADGDRSTIMGIMGFGSINPFGREADVFISIFGQQSDTITALAALRVEAISRAEELDLREVRLGDVRNARA